MLLAPGQLVRAVARFNLNDLSQMLDAMKVLPSIVLWLAIAHLHALAGKRWERRAELFVIVGALYLCVLFAVFLITPNDLKWELMYTADRAGFAVRAMLVAAIVMHYQSWIEKRVDH